LCASLTLVSAADLTVVKVNENPVIIAETNNNATYTLRITNNEAYADTFRIYALVSATIYPKESFTIASGETKTLEVSIVPHKEVRRDKRDRYAFEYQIKGDRAGYFKDSFTIKIVDLKDVLEFSVDNIPLQASETTLSLKNLENAYVDDLKIIAKSKFFEFSQTVSLGPKETRTFTTPITLAKQIPADTYPVDISYRFNDRTIEIQTDVKYLEKGGVSVSESSSGFIIKKTTMTKANEGNIKTTATISTQKNLLTRLVTLYSEPPTTSERSGLFVTYTWEKELGVGESYTVTVTTNYTIPLLLLLLVVAVALFTRYLVTGKVSVKKRVSLVHTKGGEFALRVTLRVKAKKNVDNVVVIDRIPGHAKLYDKFGIRPHRMNESSRTIEWDMRSLSAGEERVFTYIIYSKINIVGTFELPAASVSFNHNGAQEHTYSNRTYFAAETAEK
jgi:hypothetical protein